MHNMIIIQQAPKFAFSYKYCYSDQIKYGDSGEKFSTSFSDPRQGSREYIEYGNEALVLINGR